MQTYKIEQLANSFFLVTQLGSELEATYSEDGTFRHGVRFSNDLHSLSLMGKIVRSLDSGRTR